MKRDAQTFYKHLTEAEQKKITEQKAQEASEKIREILQIKANRYVKGRDE